MSLRCVYCGAEHASATDVRACWERTSATTPETRPSPTPRTHAPPGPPAATTHAGPEPLGRGLVVRQGSLPLPGWEDAKRVAVDASVLDAPSDTIDELLRCASDRRRVVVELGVDFSAPPRSTTSTAPYRLGPRFRMDHDLLHHLVWSNAIDATGLAPVWSLLAHATSLGATPTTDGNGDIELPDGTRAWLDGGPPCRFPQLAGISVIHAMSVEHGSLAAPIDVNAAAIELAADQRAAVEHPGGSARIIAPAGSGKTRVLTERARHLLNTWRIPAGALSLIAFNKRAQEEMRDRTNDLPELNVRTLNSIALAIVNGSPPFLRQPRSLRTIDEGDVRRVIADLIKFPRKRNTDPVAPWIEALSVIRLGLRSPDEVEKLYRGDVDGLAEVFPRYRDALDRAGLLDFDEQVYRAIELLLADADAREAAQRACRLLLVDEFQDLTPAHVQLVRLLSAPHFSVFGVGDDDQTIYGFSGADPTWLIEFSALFPHAESHPLEVNYRCTADVVEGADRLLRHNRRRVSKAIRSARPESTGLVVLAGADTVDRTTERVLDAIAEGHAAGEVAVLTRVNSLLVPVHVSLTRAGIAVDSEVGPQFLERVAVRSALAWLRLATTTSPFDATDLAEALKRPSRPIHPNVASWVCEQASLDGLQRLAARVRVDRDAGRVASFAADIERLRSLAKSGTTRVLLTSLVDVVGLGDAVSTLDDSRHGMNRGAQNDDLVALLQLADQQPDPARFASWLGEQLVRRPRLNGGVTLATIHRVKGQEWPVVVVHHADADQFPHRLADDVEEERRVFHVAITRGSQSVTIVAGDNPSPFIEQMRTEPPAVLPADAPPTRRAAVTSSTPAKSRGRESRFPKGDVRAAVGLVLVDGGQDWTIDVVDGEGVAARHGDSVRRFGVGVPVKTGGHQRGSLRLPDADSPPPASLRAYDSLRRLRDRLRDGKPAYIVFSDATLEAIALALPSSLKQLGAINGIGPAKLEQYGDAVLLAIEDAVAGG